MKRYYGEIVLNGLMFDVARMMRERQSPKLILNLIKKKITFLETKNSHYNVVWWEKTLKEIDEEALRVAYLDNQDATNTARLLDGEDEDVSYY